LAAMDCATLLQDARRYARRPRSLRLEHRLATGARGQKLHAKVVLVVHEKAVRLLVGSANLTEPGCRHNREVATAIVATASDADAGALVRQAFGGQASALLAPWWTPGADRVVARALALLESWNAPAALRGVRFVWSGGPKPLWQHFVETWPEGRR